MAPAGFPTTATLPANAGGVFMTLGFIHHRDISILPTPGLRLSPAGESPSDLSVTVVDHSIAPFLRHAIRTDALLPVGATLTLRAANPCDLLYSDGGVPALADVASWTVTDAVPLPTTLGTLGVEVVASGTVPQPTLNATCDEPMTTTYADLVLAPSTEAAPWSDLFVYETLVDGEVFLPTVSISPFNGYSGQSQAFGGSWRGRGIDRVFARCGSMTNGLPEGTHGVSMRARLPDGTVVTTAEVSIRLTCPPDGTLHGSGCSVPTARGQSAMPGFALLAAALGWLRRRARRTGR